MYKRTPILAEETLKARKIGMMYSECRKEKKKKKKNFQPKILYKAKLLFRIERDRKSFPDKQKQK